MIFDAISRVNKVLQKNVDKRRFLLLISVWCLTLATPVVADLSEVLFTTPIVSGKFYDTSFIGITSQNTLTKYSITGQKFWTVSIEHPPLQQLDILFNRVIMIDGQGSIECRDGNFGIRLWGISSEKYRRLFLQYPIFFALRDNGAIDAFDFSSGCLLYGVRYPESCRIFDKIPNGGGLFAQNGTNVSYISPDLSDETIITHEMRPTGEELDITRDRLAYLDNTTIRVSSGDSTIDTYVLGSSPSQILIPKNRFVSINYSESDQNQWIIHYPLLVEINLPYGLIRAFNVTTDDTYLEWKELDPDKKWNSVWWQNGLVGLVNSDNVLTIWDYDTNRILGSVPWDAKKGHPIAINYTRDIISIATSEKMYVAAVRRN